MQYPYGMTAAGQPTRSQLPPFAWNTSTYRGTPVHSPEWPNYAKTLFEAMRDEPDVYEEPEVPIALPEPDEAMFLPAVDEVTQEHLAMLMDLGFDNVNENQRLLIEQDNDVERVIDYLCNRNSEQMQQQCQDVNSVQLAGDAVIDLTSDVGTSPISAQIPPEMCDICVSEAGSWHEAKCGHRVCTDCHEQIQKERTTMSGQRHTFFKCPFCQAFEGIEIGDCPDGTMTVHTTDTPVAGYSRHGSIHIRYIISQDQHYLDRSAYSPDSPEGKQVLALLQVAWDRRLTFKVGTSATTGQQNVLIWNLHHKTSRVGGIQMHGFPDDTYLDRIKEELAQRGIQ
jgi:deltex-like protein